MTIYEKWVDTDILENLSIKDGTTLAIHLEEIHNYLMILVDEEKLENIEKYIFIYPVIRKIFINALKTNDDIDPIHIYNELNDFLLDPTIINIIESISHFTDNPESEVANIFVEYYCKKNKFKWN